MFHRYLQTCPTDCNTEKGLHCVLKGLHLDGRLSRKAACVLPRAALYPPLLRSALSKLLRAGTLACHWQPSILLPGRTVLQGSAGLACPEPPFAKGCQCVSVTARNTDPCRRGI